MLGYNCARGAQVGAIARPFVGGSATCLISIADQEKLGHSASMSETTDDFEQAARIVEAFSEGETDDRVIDLLSQIATAIREKAIND